MGGDPVNYRDPTGTNRESPTFCDVYPEDPSCDPWYEPFSGLNTEGPPATPDCSKQFGGSWNLWSSFVTANSGAAATVAQKADLPTDWILAWASVESSWGAGDMFKATGNYFSWHGDGDQLCSNGSLIFNHEGCFSSFESSAMTALFSTDNNMHYSNYTGSTGLSSSVILTDNATSGPKVAFQALADAGYDTDPVTGPAYGATTARRVRLIDRVVNCLQSKE